MKITKKQLRKIISEEKAALVENYEFAPTAEEEAKRINDQAGPGPYGLQLVTDQAFWEKQGITTGEELAFNILSQEYSDAYKALHGIRPRWARFENVKQVQDALEDLDREAEALAEDQAFWATIEAEWEKERQELASLSRPGLDLDYDKFPKQQGFGRRTESKIVMTRGQLRKLLKEAIDAVNVETGEVMAFSDEDGSAEPYGSMIDAPEAAWPDLIKRLGLNPVDAGEWNDVNGEKHHSFELSSKEFTKLEDEVLGKRDRRQKKRDLAQYKADLERLDPERLKDRLMAWAKDAADDWEADNSGPGSLSIQDVAFDLADSAQYAFEPDEWDELLWAFDDDKDLLRSFIMDSMG